jgi:hypothetical protein
MLRFACAFGFLALVSLYADTTTPAQPVQTTHTDTVNFAPGGTIRFNNANGNVTIEAWDERKIEVTVVKSMGWDSESSAEASHRLDAVKVAVDRKSDTEAVIDTSRTPTHNRFKRALGIGREAVVTYHVRVPRNSHLVISHADGYVSVTGVAGDIEATNHRGDILLMLPNLAQYSIDAHTRAGVITSDLDGSKHMHHLTGEEFTRGDKTLAHKLDLHMGFGGITIKDLPSEAVAPVAKP